VRLQNGGGRRSAGRWGVGGGKAGEWWTTTRMKEMRMMLELAGVGD
jgi:hypothetical protein